MPAIIMLWRAVRWQLRMCQWWCFSFCDVESNANKEVIPGWIKLLSGAQFDNGPIVVFDLLRYWIKDKHRGDSRMNKRALAFFEWLRGFQSAHVCCDFDQ
jgi:hypothetical protein